MFHLNISCIINIYQTNYSLNSIIYYNYHISNIHILFFLLYIRNIFHSNLHLCINKSTLDSLYLLSIYLNIQNSLDHDFFRCNVQINQIMIFYLFYILHNNSSLEYVYYQCSDILNFLWYQTFFNNY